MTTALSNLTEHEAQPGQALSRPPLDPVHEAVVAERKADAGVGRPAKKPTRDAAIALQYRKLVGLQPHVLARIEKALLDEKDPLHGPVMEKLMTRLVPTDFWAKLATQEFAASGPDAKPSVTIIIGEKAGLVVSEQ